MKFDAHSMPPANDLPPIGHRRVTHHDDNSFNRQCSNVCRHGRRWVARNIQSQVESVTSAWHHRHVIRLQLNIGSSCDQLDDQIVGVRRRQWSIALIVPTDDRRFCRQFADAGDDAGMRPPLATPHAHATWRGSCTERSCIGKRISGTRSWSCR